jgi:molybdopterin/thiamine biosynthesis adenylyltransferase
VFRPRVKFEHRPVRIGDGVVRLGGVIRGIAVDVSDGDGWVWALICLLDGSRTVEQVVTELDGLFPLRTEQHVRMAIRDLVDAGFVTDAAEPVPTDLSAQDQARYSRSRLLLQWMDRRPRVSGWETQRMLRAASVAVIGLGGVGGTAALALTMSGIGRLHCVDPDTIELSNLSRQSLYTENDLGRSKVEAAMRQLNEHNSGVVVTGERLAIADPAMVRSLASEFDLLLVAADQPDDILSWVNRECRVTGTPWVHGGYHGPLVTIGVYRGDAGPCYDCGRTAEVRRRTDLPTCTSWPVVSPTRTHAANAVTAGIAGNLAAHAVLRLVTDTPGFRVNCQYGLNLVTLDDCYPLGPESVVPGCPACDP